MGQNKLNYLWDEPIAWANILVYLNGGTKKNKDNLSSVHTILDYITDKYLVQHSKKMHDGDECHF